eukprot:1196086-Prorocentrum_minimum.AAC.3
MGAGHIMHAPEVIFSYSIPERLRSRLSSRFSLLRSVRPWAVSLRVGLTETSELKELRALKESLAESTVSHEDEGFVCVRGGPSEEGYSEASSDWVLVCAKTMRGAVYGAYAVLEVLGEPILHPLRRITEPVKASWESWPVPANSLWVEKPNWKVCLAGLSHWRMSLEDLTGSTAQYVKA